MLYRLGADVPPHAPTLQLFYVTRLQNARVHQTADRPDIDAEDLRSPGRSNGSMVIGSDDLTQYVERHAEIRETRGDRVDCMQRKAVSQNDFDHALRRDPDTIGPPPLKWSSAMFRKRRKTMANKRPKPEEIVTKLRQVEVLTGQGMPRLDAIRQIGVTEQTFYRWKKKYGGMGTDQLKELKRLQKENERLRKAVSDLTLDKLILAEAAKGV